MPDDNWTSDTLDVGKRRKRIVLFLALFYFPFHIQLTRKHNFICLFVKIVKTDQRNELLLPLSQQFSTIDRKCLQQKFNLIWTSFTGGSEISVKRSVSTIGLILLLPFAHRRWNAFFAIIRQFSERRERSSKNGSVQLSCGERRFVLRRVTRRWQDYL